MKKMVTFVCLLVLQMSWQAEAAVVDAPHNQAGGVSCGNCHTYSLWWQFSPSDSSPDRANLVEALCATCHSGNTAAPHAITHSSAALGSLHRTDLAAWGRTCLDCHDPHFQQQLRDWAGNPTVPDTELYLVQGTVTAVKDNGGSIDYTLDPAKTKAAWADPADWTNKTGVGRGLLLIVSASGLENSFEVTAATGNGQVPATGSISVAGKVDVSLVGSSFGLAYGQLIKKQIAVDPDRNGVFTPADVKFFDGRGGFVDDDDSDGITGICQVCHSQTHHFLADVTPDTHKNVLGTANAATLRCTACHAHNLAFGHGSDGASDCTQCHNNQKDNGDGTFTYSKHEEHLNLEIKCSRCHDPLHMRDTSGNIFLKDGEHMATTTVCVACHHDGTDLTPADGNNPPNQPDYKAGWSDTGYTFGCNGCHAIPPSYATGTPNKANSHVTHTNDQISCAKCHYSTTQDGVTLLSPGTHVDNTYSVNPAPGVTLDYAAGGCANISCHLGNSATWGASLTCLSCHQTSGSDVEGVIDPNAVGQINISQWNTSGHGRPANELYGGSGNPGAGLTCYYCHDNTIAHGSALTPFRLVNIGGADGMNGVCLSCHKTGATGYKPPYASMDLIGSTLAVDSFHGYNDGLGGKFCWDCHDPHGDTNIYMIHDRVSLRSDKVTGAPTLQSMPVVFTQKTTGADYARTSTPFNGICNVCHLNTKHYTSTSGNGGHDDGQRCTNCHHHNGSQPDNAFSQGECLDCHSVGQPLANPTRRPIASEFPQTTETAGDAHAHFGGQLDSNDCRVCHNQIYHMDGQIRLWGGDKEVQKNLQGELVNTSIVYIGNSAADMVNIEAQKYEDISDFCMSCHDTDGMNSSPYPFDPFGNGNRPPDAATKFKGSLNVAEVYGDIGMGMEGTGRIVLSHHPLSRDDQNDTGAKIECTNCHGSHSVSAAQKLANPQNTASTWTGTMNNFCLSCHAGGTDARHPGFPSGVSGPVKNWFNTPGSACDTDGNPTTLEVFDCSDKCVSKSQADAWKIDGFCDDGYAYGPYDPMDLRCDAFNNDGGACGSVVLNNGYSLLTGIDQCTSYSQAPWHADMTWSNSAHGGGSKRTWPGYVQTPQVPSHELDCIVCHDPHGSYTPTHRTGNPYMIRDKVDGTPFVDDGSRRLASQKLGWDPTLVPPDWKQYGTKGDVVIYGPSHTGNVAGFNGWKGFCSLCHKNWLDATLSPGHRFGETNSCLTCHAHGAVMGEEDYFDYNNAVKCP